MSEETFPLPPFGKGDFPQQVEASEKSHERVLGKSEARTCSGDNPPAPDSHQLNGKRTLVE